MWAELLAELIGQIFVEIFMGSIIKFSEYLWPFVRTKSVPRRKASLIQDVP
jgi:hypothetical protein